MSEIRFLMRPATALGLFVAVARRRAAKVIIRRPSCEAGAAQFLVFEGTAESLVETYLRQGYQELLLSLSGTPSHPTDWAFYEKGADGLIIAAGGRQTGSFLERWYVRTFSKVTTTRPLFTDLRKSVIAISRKGVVANGSSPYPDVYYEMAATGLHWRESLESSKITYTPLER